MTCASFFNMRSENPDRPTPRGHEIWRVCHVSHRRDLGSFAASSLISVPRIWWKKKEEKRRVCRIAAGGNFRLLDKLYYAALFWELSPSWGPTTVEWTKLAANILWQLQSDGQMSVCVCVCVCVEKENNSTWRQTQQAPDLLQILDLKLMVVDNLLDDCDIFCIQETFLAKQGLERWNSLTDDFHEAGESTTDLGMGIVKTATQFTHAVKEFIILNVYTPFECHRHEDEYLNRLAFITSYIQDNNSSSIYMKLGIWMQISQTAAHYWTITWLSCVKRIIWYGQANCFCLQTAIHTSVRPGTQRHEWTVVLVQLMLH